jgi:hypothetical protein
MNIKAAIQKLAETRDEKYCKICIVDAVDETARTVDVSPIDESAPILGVNLQANQSGEVGVVCFPKVGSYVVVAFLSSATAVVVLTEEIDKINISTNSDIAIDAGGLVQVKNKDYSLAQAFDELISEISKLTVTTGVGASGTPINAIAFQNIKTKIEKLLK